MCKYHCPLPPLFLSLCFGTSPFSLVASTSLVCCGHHLSLARYVSVVILDYTAATIIYNATRSGGNTTIHVLPDKLFHTDRRSSAHSTHRSIRSYIKYVYCLFHKNVIFSLDLNALY